MSSTMMAMQMATMPRHSHSPLPGRPSPFHMEEKEGTFFRPREPLVKGASSLLEMTTRMISEKPRVAMAR